MSTRSSGRIYFWPGGSLWIGRGQGRTDWHAHHAHQLTLAPSGSFRFRAGPGGDWSDYSGALVPSHCSHQFEVDGVEMAHLFIEPESRAGRALVAAFGGAAVARLPEAEGRALAERLWQAFRTTPDREAMVAQSVAGLAALCGAGTEPDHRLDPRLARALAHLRAELRRPVALAEVAAHVALSPSRFRHLFVAGTGCTFRAYLLWLRINLAIECAQAGATWTEAAHEAGFADSAHLTRTHRRVFGIEPTAVRPEGA